MAILRTYEPLAYTSLTSPASTISFTNISSNYTDLTFVLIGKLDTTENVFGFRLNGDSTVDAYMGRIWGQTNTSTGEIGVAGSTSGRGLLGWLSSSGISMMEFTLFDYTSTDKFKALNGFGVYSYALRSSISSGAVWKNTSAVTSIEFRTDAGNFANNFSITMYGVKRA